MRIRLFWCIAGVILLIVTGSIAQTKPQNSDTQPFIGTWTAVHAGTPIIVVHLHSEKGELAGEVQVCSYNVNTESTGTVEVVTDKTLSKNVAIRNVKVSGRSMSFEWTDPDGDTDHWRLELTGKDSGQIVWVDLPSGVKVQPIPVNKNVPNS